MSAGTNIAYGGDTIIVRCDWVNATLSNVLENPTDATFNVKFSFTRLKVRKENDIRNEERVIGTIYPERVLRVTIILSRCSALRWLFPKIPGWVRVGRYLAHDPTTIAADLGMHPESWTQECDAEAFEPTSRMHYISAVNVSIIINIRLAIRIFGTHIREIRLCKWPRLCAANSTLAGGDDRFLERFNLKPNSFQFILDILIF